MNFSNSKNNLFQSISSITFQNSLLLFSTFTQDFLCILSHHSNLEQSITFLSCEFLSLEGKINYIDKSLKVILVLQISLFKNSCCIYILFSGLLKIGSLYSILVFPGLLETRESLREDCSLSVLRHLVVSFTDYKL